MYIILSKNVNTVEFTSISNEFKSMEQMSEEIVLLNTCQPQSNAHFWLIIYQVLRWGMTEAGILL